MSGFKEMKNLKKAESIKLNQAANIYTIKYNTLTKKKNKHKDAESFFDVVHCLWTVWASQFTRMNRLLNFIHMRWEDRLGWTDSLIDSDVSARHMRGRKGSGLLVKKRWPSTMRSLRWLFPQSWAWHYKRWCGVWSRYTASHWKK